MRILVIGGSGFMGKYVVAQLARGGHEVAVLGRPGGKAPAEAVRRIAGDRKRLGDSGAEIAGFAPEVVIDMIASSGQQARALVEVVRGVARRTVVVSSMDVYRSAGVLHGFETGPLEPLPLTERSALRTVRQTYAPAQIAAMQQIAGWLDSEYDKIAVEEAVRAIDATVLRLPMVYGPGDPLHRLRGAVKRIADRRPAMVLARSIAEWRGTRGYVENVAQAIALAATRDDAAGRTFNVGERETPTELDWARRVAADMGWRGEFAVVPDEETPPHLRAPGNMAQHWVLDATKIRDELGYAEAVAPGDALARTIAWELETVDAGVIPAAFDYAAEDAALAARSASRAV